MSEETTSIQELPTTQNAPSNQIVVQQSGGQSGGQLGGQSRNMQNSMENNIQYQAQKGQTGPHPPNELNNIIAGLQKAASNGATELPSRDRPMQTNQVMMDQGIKPDYVPEQPSVDYIKNYDTQQSQIQQLQQDKQRTLNLSYLMDEFQLPIIVGLLFYIFQMPFANTLLQKYLTFMFKKDGHYNQIGYISVSVLFGAIYYSTTLALKHID